MRVTCITCGEEVFECVANESKFSGCKISASDFIPLVGESPKDGDEMKCPRCGGPFYYEEDGYALLRCGDAWWPHPPLKKKP